MVKKKNKINESNELLSDNDFEIFNKAINTAKTDKQKAIEDALWMKIFDRWTGRHDTIENDLYDGYVDKAWKDLRLFVINEYPKSFAK